MEFSAAAAYFDEDEIFDAYSDDLLFLGHTTPHDDHTSSGATSRRRTLVAAVDARAPARRVIRWHDSYWLVGNDNVDSFRGEAVRRSFGLKKSTGVMSLLTPGQAATGIAGVQFHAHKEYYRDMTDAMSSADFDTMWNVFCPFSEPVAKGMFLRQDNTLFRVRNVIPTVDEFLTAEADQFDADAIQQAVFTQGAALDFDTGAAPATTSVMVIQTDVPKYYTFRNEAESGNKPGDRTVFVAKSAVTPAVGDHLAMLGASWRVVTVVSEGDSWILRARMGS